MSRKSTVYGFKAMSAVDATVPQTSISSEVGSQDKFSYLCKFSAISSGSFTVEATNDDVTKTPNSITWYTVDFGQPLTVTAQTIVTINLFELPFKAIRLKWSGGGVGTLTATVATKSVGV